MKYKVGDEVLVKGKITNIGGVCVKYYDVEFHSYSASVSENEIIESKTYEQGLHEGRKERWELVKKLEALPPDEREEILGYRTLEAIIADLTAEYVADRMEAYENKIKVGDVVRDAENTTEIWVTEINGNTFGGIKLTPTDEHGKFGGIYSLMSLQGYVKTGKHIDIESLLRQIGE